MFSLVTGLYDSYLAPTQLNLLVVGAPSVGKTTLLERLKVTEIPKRPDKNAPPQQMPEALTSSLEAAFFEGGAVASPLEAVTGSMMISSSSSSHHQHNSNNASSSRNKFSLRVPLTPVLTQKRRFLPLICPAPERYLKSAQDQEEDFEEETTTTKKDNDTKTKVPQDGEVVDATTEPLAGEEAHGLEAPGTPQAPRRVRCHSKEFSMDDIDLINGDSATNSNDNNGGGVGDRGFNTNRISETEKSHFSSMESIPIDDTSTPLSRNDTKQKDAEFQLPNIPLLQPTFQEFHVKPKGKMLPMSKIRPTIGTNLGKLDMYGAKCNVFDVGGKLQDLWERYYDDCDAVIFCWKLGEDPDKGKDDHNSDDYDDDDVSFDLSQQQEILNQVRKSIPDDVPFLIFGHVFGNVNVQLVDKMYVTNLILPHYHNPMTGLCCGSAKTGAGVKSAMEWLIPLAKRQQKFRLAARKQTEEKKD